MKVLIIITSVLISTSIMGNWKESKNKCGVKVSLKKIEGSSIKAFRVEGIVGAKPELIVKTLMDFKNFVKWHDSILEAKELKKISDNKILAYMKIDFPWPVKNRDSIATSEVVKNGEEVKVLIQRSNDQSIKTKNIRVSKTEGYWSVKPHPKGAYVYQQLHAEPGGSIPDWVVNLMLDKSPYKTFKGLRKYLGGKGCL